MILVIGIILFVIFLAFLTENFTDFGFIGKNNPHKFCEKCGRRVV